MVFARSDAPPQLPHTMRDFSDIRHLTSSRSAERTDADLRILSSSIIEAFAFEAVEMDGIRVTNGVSDRQRLQNASEAMLFSTMSIKDGLMGPCSAVMQRWQIGQLV